MSAASVRPGLALALLLPACGLLDDGTGDTDEAATYGTAATFVPTTGEPTPCITADDCPPAAICQRVQCIDGACVHTILAAGQSSDDLPGDCASYLCDGADGYAPVDDPADLPDDGNSCTVDLCQAGVPDHSPVEPGTACDGGFCHSDLTCQPCAERDTCDDDGAEPNQTQSKATVLAQVSDHDGVRFECDALAGGDDLDWFRFDAVDSVLGKVAPTIVLDRDNLEVCAYFQCKNAGTAVACPEGTLADNSPLGQQGCCGRGSFSPALDCKGIDEDARVWISVRRDPERSDPDECINYQLGHEY